MEQRSREWRENPAETDELVHSVEEAEPCGWRADYTGSDHADRMARLAADKDLVRRAVLERFAGTAWAELSSALAEYGYPVMAGLIRSGEVFRCCREKGIALRSPPESGLDPATAQELAIDSVAIGLTMFKNRILATGRWNPTGGASLTTFFVGQCLIQFATVYGEWVREVHKQRALESALMAFPVGGRSDQLDPAVLFERTTATVELLNQISDPLTRAIVDLKLAGSTQAEIREALSITDGVIEGRLHRLRRRRVE